MQRVCGACRARSGYIKCAAVTEACFCSAFNDPERCVPLTLRHVRLHKRRRRAQGLDVEANSDARAARSLRSANS